jgi:hypothetical protein
VATALRDYIVAHKHVGDLEQELSNDTLWSLQRIECWDRLMSENAESDEKTEEVTTELHMTKSEKKEDTPESVRHEIERQISSINEKFYLLFSQKGVVHDSTLTSTYDNTAKPLIRYMRRMRKGGLLSLDEYTKYLRELDELKRKTPVFEKEKQERDKLLSEALELAENMRRKIEELRSDPLEDISRYEELFRQIDVRLRELELTVRSQITLNEDLKTVIAHTAGLHKELEALLNIRKDKVTAYYRNVKELAANRRQIERMLDLVITARSQNVSFETTTLPKNFTLSTLREYLEGLTTAEFITLTNDIKKLLEKKQ